MPTVRASGSVSTRFPAHSTKPSTWRTRLCTPPNGAARERSPAFPPMRNGFNPFPSRNRCFPVPKGILLHSFLKNPASARACKGNPHPVACLRDKWCCTLQRSKAPYAFGHGKSPRLRRRGAGTAPDRKASRAQSRVVENASGRRAIRKRRLNPLREKKAEGRASSSRNRPFSCSSLRFSA